MSANPSSKTIFRDVKPFVLMLANQIKGWNTARVTSRDLARWLARRFKSTNQHIATVGSSKPQPCPGQGCLFGRDTLIGGFESTRIPQMPLVEIFAPVMLRKLVLHATSGSLFSRNFGRIELSFGRGIDTYLVHREPVFSR